MNIKDYIIVGQGLAGSLLAQALLKAGKEVLVIDAAHQGAASKVAAGIINPITGRRFVKSWMIDQLLPEARRTYGELEALLGQKLLYERPIYRVLFTAEEENNWYSRSSQIEFAPYIDNSEDWPDYDEYLTKGYSACQIKSSMQVDLPLLIESFRKYLKKEGRLLSGRFEFDHLEMGKAHVGYKNYKARRIVCCEGIGALQNPSFNWLPFVPAKGEVLLIRIPGLRLDKIIKYGIMIAPLGNDLYWVGSNYEWNPTTHEPSQEKGAELLEKIKEILKVPFEVVDHLAAIRPTTKDRRPFLGQHPKYQNLFIFNGLGTKGASLGPYWAKQMANYLLEGEPLADEVNIARFR